MAAVKQNKFLKTLDYFFVLRPMLFYPGWSSLLAGYLILYKNQFVLAPSQIHALNYVQIAILLILFAAAMGASFLLNQLADVQSDLKNNKLFLISEGHIPKKKAIVEVILLSALSLIMAFPFGFAFFLTVAVFIILTGYLYNFAPFKFKDRSWMSLWANMGMGFLAFVLGWLAIMEEVSWHLLIDSLPYLFLNTALYLFTTLPDVEGDRQAGKKTLSVNYGLKSIIWASFLLYLASAISSFWLEDHLAMIMVFPAFPFFVWTVIRPQVSSTILATKFSILFFAVAICLKIPYYFLLMVVGFFATRWYFKKRFDFDYPNFKGKE